MLSTGHGPDELARAGEDRGFESFWVGEHTHIPAGRVSPYPGGGPLPKPYYHMADPFVSLMAAAGSTRKIKLGTAISLVIQHDPIVLAKTVATLDYLSNGRFLFGIGGGWNAEEMGNHGTPFDRRWQILRERVEAMKVIWTEEEASYSGEFVSFDRIISNPKPMQRPHPPIYYGGATPLGRRRVARYADGWIPIDILVDDLAAAKEDLDRCLEEEGREPGSVPISLFVFEILGRDLLERYAALGVERVTVVVPRRLDDALRTLDGLAEFIPQLQ